MKKMKNLSKKPKPLNNYVKFSGMVVQMGAIIALGAWSGSKLDQKMETTSRPFTIILSLLAIGIALFLVIRDVINMQKENED